MKMKWRKINCRFGGYGRRKASIYCMPSSHNKGRFGTQWLVKLFSFLLRNWIVRASHAYIEFTQSTTIRLSFRIGHQLSAIRSRDAPRMTQTRQELGAWRSRAWMAVLLSLKKQLGTFKLNWAAQATKFLFNLSFFFYCKHLEWLPIFSLIYKYQLSHLFFTNADARKRASMKGEQSWGNTVNEVAPNHQITTHVFAGLKLWRRADTFSSLTPSKSYLLLIVSDDSHSLCDAVTRQYRQCNDSGTSSRLMQDS